MDTEKDIKARLFDILEAQNAFQIKINELEKLKNTEYKKLNDMRQQAKQAELKG